MKSFSSVWKICLLGSLLSVSSAFAGPGGTGVGGGGDSRCAEFYDIASEISVDLVKIGQSRIDAVNPLVSSTAIRDLVMHLAVLPAKRLDRQAISDPTTRTTRLDVRKWKKIDGYADKIRLVSHELMVLLQLEADGEYVVSRDLFRILQSSKFALKLKSGGSVTNADGSVTISAPLYVIDNDSTYFSSVSDPNGVCINLGFTSAVPESANIVYTSKNSGSTWAADVSREGNAVKLEGHVGVKIYWLITCR